MTSMAFLTKSRSIITKSHNLKSISTFIHLSQEAQLAAEPPLPPPQTTTPLPPNPASGSPLYSENWRTATSAAAAAASSLIPIGFGLQSVSFRIQTLSQTLDSTSLMNQFADWMTSQSWDDIKQLFELWIRSLDKYGKPNKPDVNLYNHYLRANLMIGMSAGELLDLVGQMEDYGILPNTASFNLVLKAMHKDHEATAAVKLLERMLQTGKEYKESLPDEESYDLVIGMLLQANQIDAALNYIDLTLKSKYMLSMNAFSECVRSCVNSGRLETLISIIKRCKETEQNKSLCPPWVTCNYIADVAMQADNSELTFYALEFMLKWITRGEKARPPVTLSVDEGLLVSALGTAGRTYNPKLLDGSWAILKRSLGEKKVASPAAYLAKIYAESNLGNLQKAFSTLHEFEKVHGNSAEEVALDLFSPFTSLNPLVKACSKNGFATLDEVYYQLESLNQSDPPYKSINALNCVILGCANIWDLDRAYQTFNAIDATFGLSPNIHSYNALICAFGKHNKTEEATKVYEHFMGLGIQPNLTTYSLLVDALLVKRDPKAALAVVNDMKNAGYEPSKEMLKKIRRRCIREMDYEANDRVESLAKEHKIWMGTERRRGMLFELQYSMDYA